ncbi:unnamed protein product, partial [Ectocarpus sp. 4 AP-2014]
LVKCFGHTASARRERDFCTPRGKTGSGEKSLERSDNFESRPAAQDGLQGETDSAASNS